MSSMFRLASMAGAVVLLILVVLAIMAIFGERLDNNWSNPPV